MERDEQVRRRAFELWENDGRPDGMEQDYWFRAEREIDAAPDTSGDTPLPESLTAPLEAGMTTPAAPPARKARAPRKPKTTTAPKSPKSKRTPRKS